MGELASSPVKLRPLLPRAATLVAWATEHQEELEANPKLVIELSFAHGFPMKWSIKVMGEQKIEPDRHVS